MTDRFRYFAVAAAMLFAALLPCSAADALKWDKSADRVDASIETWTVPQMLRRVAASTGWEIYLDPEIKTRVTTKFTDKKTSGLSVEVGQGKIKKDFALAD